MDKEKEVKTDSLPPLKRFIVRKYIMATCAAEALKLENKREPDDCYIDDDWIKAHPHIQSRERAVDAIGFLSGDEDEEGGE